MRPMSFRSGIAQLLRRFAADTSGATMIEYSFVIGLISIGIGFMIPEIWAAIDSLFLQVASGAANAAAN